MEQAPQHANAAGGKACIIVVVLILLLGLGTCGACMAGGYWMYSHFKEMALVPIELVSKINADDRAGAYALMSDRYREQATAEEFASFFADLKLKGEFAAMAFNDRTNNGVRTIAVGGTIGNQEVVFHLVPDGDTFKVDRIEAGQLATPGYTGGAFGVTQTLPADAIAVVRENDLAQVTVKTGSWGAQEDAEGKVDLSLDVRLLGPDGEVLFAKEELTSYTGTPPRGSLVWTITLDPRPESDYAKGLTLEVKVTDRVAEESLTATYALKLPE